MVRAPQGFILVPGWNDAPATIHRRGIVDNDAPYPPVDDHLRQPSHRYPGVPCRMVHGPSARRILPRPQSGVQDDRPSRRSRPQERGLHRVHDQGSAADDPASEGDRIDGAHVHLPGDPDPLREGDRARGAVQGGYQRRLHTHRRQDRQGQDGMEVRSRASHRASIRLITSASSG